MGKRLTANIMQNLKNNKIRMTGARLLSALLIMAMLLGFSIKSEAKDYVTLSSTSFKDYNITTIHIGSDVYEIMPNAFRALKHLQCITVSENNKFYSSYSGCLYDKFQTELICFPPALQAAYIPSTVTEIGETALRGLPDKLKSEIRAAVENNQSTNYNEWDIPGAHFIHTGGSIMWMTESGDIVTPTPGVMAMAADIVGVSTTMTMKQAEQLESAFYQLSNSIVYERSEEVPSGDWITSYAYNTLQTRKGNCYGYAAAFGYIAKGLGYDAMVCTGTVTSALGGRTPHAWTEVKIGRKWYIFDAEMQRAKGGGYYKQTYDSYPAGPIIKEKSYPVNY